MEKPQSEQDPLSDGSVSTNEYGSTPTVSTKNPRINLKRRMSYSVNKPRFTVIVEPILGAMFFCILGVFPLVEQYIYARIARNYPVLANATTNQSISEVCQSINGSEDDRYNATQLVQGETAQLMMYLNIASAVPSLFATLIIGGYSDTLYRKPALVSPVIGLVLRMAITVSVILFELPVYILFVATFLDGCFGSVGTISMGAFSYIADIIEPEQRAFRMVLLDVVLALSGALAETLLGFLIKAYGFLTPCLVILGVSVAALLYTIFLVPETHVPFPDARFSLKESLVATFKVYSKKGPRRFKIWLILIVILLAEIPMVSGQSVSTLYQMNLPLCFGPAMIGVYMAVALFVIQGGSFFGSVVFVKCLKFPNIVVVLIGGLSGVAAHTFYSMAVETWQVFIVPVLGMFELLPLPMSRAIASNLVDISEQGAMFAGMSVLYTIASVAGSLLYSLIYAATLSWFHGTVFVISAGLYLLSFLFASVYFVQDRMTDRYTRLRTLGVESTTE